MKKVECAICGTKYHPLDKYIIEIAKDHYICEFCLNDTAKNNHASEREKKYVQNID